VGVEQGIILAIVLSVILHVRRHYAPHDAVVSWDESGRFTTTSPTPGTMSEPGLVVYRFGVGLFYANAERLSEEVLGLVDTPTPPRWFVLDAIAVDDVDYTGGKTLAELADQLAKRGIVFAIVDADPDLRRELDRFGVTAKIGEDHYYDSLQAARDAFHKASFGVGPS
jgi:MFS superfamily sulfate permease-like transporter